ncbi:MAG: hypothetical protein AB2598_10745 [Candidatus Thiodiazotropha sp.]
MIDPDLNDPAWLVKREETWEGRVRDLSGHLSRKQIKQIRPMFFELEFDYGNEDKYGEYKHDFERASNYCPVQTRERWRRYITEDIPRWLGDDFDLRRYMESFAHFDNQYRMAMGWDMQTELEVIDYLLGNGYVENGYVFEGRCVDYPVPANRIYFDWIFNVYHWLAGNTPQADVKWSHLIDFWVSTLPYVHRVFFSYKRSSHGRVKQGQNWLQNVLVLIQEYSLDKLTLKQKEERSAVIESDTGRRKEFVDELVRALDCKELPSEFSELWNSAKQSGFEPSDQFDYMDPKDDVGNEVMS